MLTIILNAVSWEADFPLWLPKSFSSHVKFNELLELEVGATISVFQPSDRKFLNDDTEWEQDHEMIKEMLRLWPDISVNTGDEQPEWEICNPLFLFIRCGVRIPVLLDDSCWEAEPDEHKQDEILDSCNLSSKLKGDVEAIDLVLFGNHLDHLDVTLALDSTTLDAFSGCPVDFKSRSAV